MILRVLFFAAVFIWLSGCEGNSSSADGDSSADTPTGGSGVRSGGTGQGTTGSRFGFAVAMAGDLNIALPCTADLRSQLAYSLDAEAFMVCNGTAWTAIDIRGPKGDQGAQGAQGPAGSQGAQGPAGTFTVTAPTLSDSTLTISDLDIDGARVSWQPATVSSSVKKYDVEYMVILSESDNIGTLSDINANGTIVTNWQTATSAMVTGLTMNKQYFVNVIARVHLGGYQAYQSQSFTTPSAAFLFSILGTSGSFTRSSIDSLCESRATALGMTQSNIRALVSISATDEIADMPTNYGLPTGVKILSLSKAVIANNWAGLTAGTTNLVTPLNTAGVVSNSFWTGSNGDGTYSTSNCTGWTGSSAGMMGGFSGSTWLASIGGTCGTSRPALCIGWD